MKNEIEEKPYDKVKYTWLRYVILFMIKYPLFRAKWFLWLFRNWTSHICYKDGKIVQKFPVNYFTRFIKPCL